MKWFNYKIMVAHKADLKVLRDTKLNAILPFVSQIANTFPRESNAIGTLDINDLIQAGYVGLIEAWNKVDWEMLESVDNPDGTLWSFLKKRIKWSIRREIDKHGAFVARPINQMELTRNNWGDLGQVGKVLVTSYPKFFDNQRSLMYSPDYGPWKSLQLEIMIEDELKALEQSSDNRHILLQFYGIGTDKLSTKELGEKYRKNHNAISQIIFTTRNKLKTSEFENKIKNFLENS